MCDRLDVPHLADLRDLGIEVDPSEQPGVVSVAARANDGNTVTLTWDEIAGSVSIRWLDDDQELLVVEREFASKVSVRDERGRIQFRV